MTLITSEKPATDLALKVGVWTTVAWSAFPNDSGQVHAMLYANISGRATPGAAVVQVDVQALRDGGTDETALQTYTAAVRDDGTWRCRITHTWFGARTMNTLAWQVMPGENVTVAAVKSSRYAKGMTN